MYEPIGLKFKAPLYDPNFVAYGVDCSDSDPAKWRQFGVQQNGEELPKGWLPEEPPTTP
jgi:hypothetical protein